MTTTSRPLSAKEDMSTDKQEDSSGNRKVLEESQDAAKQREEVKQNIGKEGILLGSIATSTLNLE